MDLRQEPVIVETDRYRVEGSLEATAFAEASETAAAPAPGDTRVDRAA